MAGFDGITEIDGGWLDHHYVQLAYQLADSMSGLAYSFVMTVRTARLAFFPFLPDFQMC